MGVEVLDATRGGLSAGYAAKESSFLKARALLWDAERTGTLAIPLTWDKAVAMGN